MNLRGQSHVLKDYTVGEGNGQHINFRTKVLHIALTVACWRHFS
jgi:hypothetical protein